MSQENLEMTATEARATAKFLRYSAQKGRLVADMIRGKRVDEAIALLEASKKAAAKTTLKVLKSAMAKCRRQQGFERRRAVYQNDLCGRRPHAQALDASRSWSCRQN